jgi:hypothetical protein
MTRGRWQVPLGCQNSETSCPQDAGGISATVWNTDGLPSLKSLHPRSTIEADPSFRYWSNQPTEAIVRSLAPDSDEPLLVKPNGTIYDGNTRIAVLEDRGYNVNALPRDIFSPEVPLGGEGDDFFEG